MPFALRKQFIDRTIDAADLHTALNLWRHWYLQAHAQARQGLVSLPEATLQLEVRFWGFGRQDAARFQEAIAGHPALPPGASASLFDPDTVALASPAMPLGVPSPDNTMILLGAMIDPTPYLLLAISPAFEDLCIEFRLRLHSVPGKGGAKLNGNTMVFFGTGREGRYLLRSCWPAGPGEDEEAIFGHVAWPDELKWMQCLFDAGQQGLDAAPLPAWATQLFPAPSAASIGRAVMWFLNPGGKRRIGAVALRLFLSGTVAVALASLLWTGGTFRPSLVMVVGPPLLIALLGFGFVLFWTVFMIVETYRRMNANMRRSYSGQLRHPEIVLSERPDLLHDPGVCKYSADIEVAGGQHFRDVRLDPPPGGDFLVRLFLVPKWNTVFALSFMYGLPGSRFFPARPSFLVKTYFTDGSYFVSTNGHSGYRKRLPDIPVHSRVFAGEQDPATMLARHKAALDRLIASGHQVAPLDPEEILPLMEAEHDRLRTIMEKRGYFSWEAAIRQVFDLVRPEYR